VRPSSFLLKSACSSDAEQCEELTRAVTLSDKPPFVEQGFLLSATSAETFREYIATNSLFVAREGSIIIGFILAYPRESPHFTDMLALFPKISWTDPAIAERPKLIYVDKKAVHPRYRRRGIATAMYQFLFTKYSDHCFIGATVEKPILNLPSQQFRIRHGFRRVGEFRADEFQGLKGYQSGIYARDGERGEIRGLS
jgi:ribosomal protein S18 acetylase RimI-like enzyme